MPRCGITSSSWLDLTHESRAGQKKSSVRICNIPEELCSLFSQTKGSHKPKVGSEANVVFDGQTVKALLTLSQNLEAPDLSLNFH